jgi:hypothetical protein
MAVGQFLKLRLFIEGVEVPVVSANIQSSKNAPAAASIQIPANDYALEFKPRSLIHLFMFDLYNGAPPAEQVSVGGPGIRVVDRDNGVDPELAGLFPPERFESTQEQDLTDLENENYKLIFGGEMVGVQFSKSPTSRSIVLQCLDWSSYWDIAYQYQVGGMSLGGGGIRAAFTGASTSVFNDFLEGSADIITHLMETPPRAYPSLRGTLLGAMTHLIEAIGGIYFGRRAIRGVNDFFSLAEMRLHLTQMLGANPFPERDELRLLHANGFGSLFRRSLSGLGRLVSIRQIMMALQRYIFHEIIPITAPRFIPAPNDPAFPTYEERGIEEDPDTRPLAQAARAIKSRAEEIKERQSESTDTNAARRQSDRRGGLLTELRRLSRTCDRAGSAARHVGLQGEYSPLSNFFGIPEVSRAFVVAGNNFNQILDATRRGQRADVRTYTFYDPSTSSASVVTSMCDQIIQLMQEVLNSRHNRRIQRATSQPDPPPRLLTQIYRPDVWMVAPPRCNVFFPELYSQFSYGRNYQAEVTRMLLRTHSAFFGSDILFDGFYMAPSRILGARTGRAVGRGRVGIDPPDLSDAPAWVVRDMLDHELFTGIIPAFERMSDLNLHALRGGSAEINGVRVGYAQLAANHIFFQYRFRSRELMLQGKFNPYAVLGFPVLVVDKYLPQDLLREGEYDPMVAARLAEAVREGEGEIGPPSEERSRIAEANNARVAEVQADILAGRPNTHYLGTPASIMHSIDASTGGSTQIQMEYARTTNERTEYLGDNVSRAGRARRTRNIRRTTIVACLEAPQVESRGYYGGRIVEVTDVTDQYQRRVQRRSADRSSSRARYQSDTLLPLFVGDRRFNRARRGTRVVVGVEQAAATYGPEVVALVGSAGSFDASTETNREILVTFTAYRIVEEIGAYRTEDVELPPEDITFPPWYGDHYRTNQIGGLYAYYFGTGAITDPLYVLEPGTDPAQFDNAATTQAAAEEDAGGRARAASIAYVNTFATAARAAIASEGQGPQPGDSASPDLGSGETMGPPGEANNGVISQVRNRSAISEAVEEIVRAYSQVRTRKFDVHEFIRSYTWRPIASMVDMLGTANLEINDSGSVVRGREGFHSRAFGDYDDLRQLVNNAEGRPQTILGLTTRDPDETGDTATASRDEAISARLDTRKEKRIAVLKYLSQLGASCGVLG